MYVPQQKSSIMGFYSLTFILASFRILNSIMEKRKLLVNSVAFEILFVIKECAS